MTEAAPMKEKNKNSLSSSEQAVLHLDVSMVFSGASARISLSPGRRSFALLFCFFINFGISINRKYDVSQVITRSQYIPGSNRYRLLT